MYRKLGSFGFIHQFFRYEETLAIRGVVAVQFAIRTIIANEFQHDGWRYHLSNSIRRIALEGAVLLAGWSVRFRQHSMNALAGSGCNHRVAKDRFEIGLK
jgi:hypothetical protein